MNRHPIHIDAAGCIGCGLCRQDCPENNIDLINRKAVVKTQACIGCGHCVAICPKAAVSMAGFDEPPLDIRQTGNLDPQRLLEAIQTRRSIRQFKDRPIDPDILTTIIDAGRWSPTAKNAQDISYIVLKDNKKIYEKIAVAYFKKLIPLAGLVYPPAKGVAIDDDFFFKKAPAAIMIMSKDTVSGALAASNMALMAEACGLGVLYSGFFTIAANHCGKLRRALGLKRNKVVTTLVLGYANVSYPRTPQREKASVRYE